MEKNIFEIFPKNKANRSLRPDVGILFSRTNFPKKPVARPISCRHWTTTHQLATSGHPVCCTPREKEKKKLGTRVDHLISLSALFPRCPHPDHYKRRQGQPPGGSLRICLRPFLPLFRWQAKWQVHGKLCWQRFRKEGPPFGKKNAEIIIWGPAVRSVCVFFFDFFTRLVSDQQ